MSAVVSPVVPLGAIPRQHPVWSRYLHGERTHEVLAEWRHADGTLRLRETSPSAPDARWEETLRIAEPWEARVAIWQLEGRLSLLGAYWQQRSSDVAWRALVRPAGTPTPDVRRNTVIAPLQAPLVHHYHDPHGSGDRLIAALRGERQRYALVSAQLDVPSLEIGRIDVIHHELPDAMMRSLALREQLLLAASGLPKLVNRDDYARAFGSGGEARAERLIDEVITRVRENQLARPLPRLEDSDAYAEFLVTIHDPRLAALHKRFLKAGDEEALLAGGPPAIRKAIAALRQNADHNAQHLLTILEASLLARERMRTGRLVGSDPEVRALTRLAYYL